MSRKRPSFRVGRVQADLRGQVWYLYYHENGKRHRPRVGTSREAARQLAAQVNAQLEAGAPAAFSFEPIAIAELRRRWSRCCDCTWAGEPPDRCSGGASRPGRSRRWPGKSPRSWSGSWPPGSAPPS